MELNYIDIKPELICCLICNGTSRVKNQSRIYKCDRCGLEFVSPMPTEEELNKFYTGYKNFRASENISTINAKKNFEHLQRYGLEKSTRLLDFGCGENFFVRANSEKWVGYDKYIHSEFPEGKFEFITLFGVLEHLINPIEALKDLTERLEKNGKIVMTTVGTETGIAYQYKVPEHVSWWTKKSIEMLFKQVGLKVLEISNYQMFQEPSVYLKCVLNAGKVPEEYATEININLTKPILVPTNEIFIVGEKS